MFVVFPFLASASQISEVSDMTSAPSALLNTWAGNPDLKPVMVPSAGFGTTGEWIDVDTQGASPVALSLDSSAGESAIGAVSQPGTRFTLAILIFFVLAALLRGFPSPAFPGFEGHLMMERRADSTVLGLVSILFTMAVFVLKWRKA